MIPAGGTRCITLEKARLRHCPEAEKTFQRWLAMIRRCHNEGEPRYGHIRRDERVKYWMEAYRWHRLHCQECQQLHTRFLQTAGVAYEPPTP
ncbi:MAG: hypothetical protein DWQ07_12885 [Chloroflexi bacterium]|nr:MAG: hypothetical protein DWQ07_12885 [Chloroflexota bacterium]MBL1196935.1 hypothetical protein [Chloroflexota bacterium]NOH14231.1 hypothetical protein [Chloroflexota bacterium]